MNKVHMCLLRGVLPLVLLLSAFANAQDSSQTEILPDAGISLKAYVDRTETPQNRTVELVVQLQWSGRLERYDIQPFDNPILENFDILGSGSSNRVIGGGVSTAIRKYTFTLKPQSIGMAYIEPIIIKYTDMQADADYTLTSNRIPVKVTDPISEGEFPGWLLWAIAAIVLVGGAAFVVRYFLAKKAERQKMAQEMAAADVPLEEKYLEELKSIVDLSDPAIDAVKALSKMTRLLRRYLHEKFDAPGFEATTGELHRFLYEKKFDDRFVVEVKELLSDADMIKFSGRSISRADLEKSYAVVENIFHKGMRGDISHGDSTPLEKDNP